MFLITLLACTILTAADISSSAEGYAQNYLAEASLSADSIQCSESDSDGDGHVTCTLFGGDLPPLTAIECPYYIPGGCLEQNTVCKPAQPKIIMTE